MVCQVCQEREATNHLTTTLFGEEPGTERKQHFCDQCADAYFSSTPGMNSARRLIQLSDSYRSKLYDLLEAVHPEAFDDSDLEACRRGSELMRGFLHEHLKKDHLEMNEDAFEMLCQDFFGSH